MELELGQLELRYEKLRRHHTHKERQLLASLSDKGQLLPVVVVHGSTEKSYVLVDGYKRIRALRRLKHDTVAAIVWDLCELDAVLLERLMRTGEAEGALEQGWVLKELHERFSLSHEELARRFDKSQSWVSRRLALVMALPREAQERVQNGTIPAHAAMKYLVPMARAKREDCVRLIAALCQMRPSTREIESLYATWVSGDAKTREWVINNPSIVLRVREETKADQQAPDTTPNKKLLNDFGILIGTSRRARIQLVQGLLAHFLPTEAQEASRSARQARFECEALFRIAQPLLELSKKEHSSTPNSTPDAVSPQNPQEIKDAK